MFLLQLKFIRVIIILGHTRCLADMRSDEKIRVMLSRHSGTVANRPLHRLDREIMKNFAQMAKLGIDYVVTNQTLNSIFNAAERFKIFSHSANYA